MFPQWIAAATGPGGYWIQHQPREHFQTATATELLAQLIVSLSTHLTAGVRNVIDVGAGDGALITALTRQVPQWTAHAVDCRIPANVDSTVNWHQDTWDVLSSTWTTGEMDQFWAHNNSLTMVIAHEFLDDLPLPTAGARNTAEDAWVRRWWPGPSNPEIGHTRDLAWADLVRRLSGTAADPGPGGLALMIDYGHLAAHRPATSTIRGYLRGRRVPPVFDGSMNITADVAIDAVAAAGQAAGGRTVWFTQQRDVVDLFGQQITGHPNPDAFTELITRSHSQALANSLHWGRWWWLAQAVDPI